METNDFVAAWQPHLNRGRGPLYLALVEALGRSIRAGDLRQGDRLPPQRELADVLGIDLSTVTRAFNEAKRRGLIEATVGRGSFVRAETGISGHEGTLSGRQTVVDLTMNTPPVPAEPPLARMLSDGVDRLLRRHGAASLMAYRTAGGTLDTRTAGVHWLAPVLGGRPAEDIIVTAGAQSAMLAVVGTLLHPGDVLVAERVTYPGLRALAAHLRLRLVGVAMDGEGMLPDDLDRVLAETGARLAYCTPSIQNPTTATMSLARRQEIVATLARRDALLLEDDPYALLLPEPLPSLAQLMPERVFHVATLAKTLSPGLRTAFLAVPGADHVRRLTAALRATSLTAPGLLTELAADWIESGQARRLLHAIRGELAARQATVRDALGGMATAHPCGPHVWLHLPPELRSREFVAAMRQLGLALVPSDVFTVEGDPPPRARIAIGTASTRDSLEAALSVVATELRHERFDRFDAIV